MTDILLVAVDPSLAGRISALSGHRVVTIDRDTVVGGGYVGPSMDPRFRPGVILVGSGLPPDRAISYVKVIASEHPDISVILVTEPGSDLGSRASAVGVEAVIDRRISAVDLAALLDRPSDDGHDKPKAHRPSGRRVIVVASPKGGVGKSTTAINVTALLAERSPGEVVLIDMDLQFGDLATMLDLEPKYTVADAFASGVDDSMRLRTLLTSHPANFHVLCGSDDPAMHGRVGPDQIRKLVHQYAGSFRYVVVDTPAGLHEETLASLEEASDVILVGTLDVATLRGVRREVDLLADLGLLPRGRHLAVNRADGRAGLGERDAERIVALPVVAVIPTSDRVALAANRGELAITPHRRNVVRRPFQALASAITDSSKHTKEGDR